MKSSLIYYSAISIFFFLSCTGSKEKRNMESDIITVNLERRDNISTKDLFSDIQVIPLETTPESLIRDITQIKFLRTDIISMIIEDPKSSFSTGRDVSNSRLTKGDGPGQYLNLSDFAIDTVRRNLVVLCAVSNALFSMT